MHEKALESFEARGFKPRNVGIVVVLIEALRRRPFDRKSELNFQRWGLVALLGLAAIISFLDIQRIATGQFLGGH